MFRNYFITALRNFRRNAVFSAINVIGLAIGISAALVIYLIVSYDFSFDKFEQDGDRIYRVVSDMKFPDNDFKNSGVPLPFVPAVQKDLTGIESVMPLSMLYQTDVHIDVPGNGTPGLFKKQKDIAYVDNQYFKMLSYEWLAGSPQNALTEPHTTVLTESRAKTYFPNDDVTKDIGKVITYDTIKATITGIVKDLNKTTDFTFKEFISYATIPSTQFTDPGQWGSVSSSDQVFIKLNKNVSPASVNKQAQQLMNSKLDKNNLPNILWLQPLADMHFNNDYGNFDQRLANKSTLYGLLAVAAILLLLGCINFVNLTTAQAVKRAKEIGIRKTMGSSKSQLIFQFLSETFLLTLTATILSILLVPWIIQLFADFIPPAISFNMLATAKVILFMAALVVVVSLLSGFYPSMVLSGYNPVQVLKNSTAGGSGNTRRLWIRKSLTVTQFVFAQTFIIAALIVGNQIQYVMHKDLGFKKDGIITFETPFAMAEFSDSAASAKAMQTRKVLLQQLRSLPGIENACIAGAPPATAGTSMQTMKFNDGKKDIETTVEIKYADNDFFKLYHMQLAAGRFLKTDDTLTEYVINESYAKFLGFKNAADAIGKRIQRNKDGTPIVGVVKDFYSQSLRSEIKPLVFASMPRMESELHVALKPETTAGDWKNTIAKIEKDFKEIYPAEDFSCKFFDERIADFYENEQHTSTLLAWTTGLATIISCLGLLGLAIYTTNQRTKEIGIRKVLGATILQIVNLVSVDFLKLVVLAFVIAAPIAWWGVNKWLQDFAYHASISAWLFVAAGFLMIIVAVITLSFQTIRAARANPVNSLRAE